MLGSENGQNRQIDSEGVWEKGCSQCRVLKSRVE